MTKLIILIVNIVFFGSVQLITIPLIMPIFPSVFFVTFILALEAVIGFGIIMISNDFYGLYRKKLWAFSHQHLYTNIGLLLGISIIQFLTSICFFYSSHPSRTPILIQVILLGLGIIPSVIFSKFLLEKKKSYNFVFIFASIICLLVSITLGIAPLSFSIINNKLFIWIIIYMMGVTFYSLSYVMQEKYILMTNTKASTKFQLAFYTRFIQLLLTVLMFWIEAFFGYDISYSNFFVSFYESFIKSTILFFSSQYNFWIIQLYVISRIISYILSIYLNEISANYSTIISGINTQITALFFAIFPYLNKGFQYPITITMLNIFFNILSILFWIKGEKNNQTEPFGSELGSVIDNQNGSIETSQLESSSEKNSKPTEVTHLLSSSIISFTNMEKNYT